MSKKYIDSFPKPLLEDLVAGKWLPIVGAGFSRNAVLPPKKQMPLWQDLGVLVANELGDYEPANPIDTLSAYEYEYKRPKLIELLSKLLYVYEARPGDAHKSFCEIQFDLVCTTNFDFLLEKQYEITPRPCTPLIDEDQLAINISDAGVALLKLHGDLHHPNRLIATETDYDLFLNKYPLLATYLANLLITRTAVLIGYSLDDPDFRQLWQIVGERLGRFRRTAYVITVGANRTDIVRFERRGIKVINISSNKSNYGLVLSDTFKELSEYWRDNLINASYVKEEQPLRELSLPMNSYTRLCFFSIPFTLSSFYRDKVFPIVKDYGFVPITADDVFAPRDAIFAKIDALIQRTQLIVIDLSSNNKLIELQLALKNNIDPSRILIITHESKVDPRFQDLSKSRILKRPDIYSVDPEIFIRELRIWFSGAAERFEKILISEPKRLLFMGEYRAAVISSITLLETSLRKWLDINFSKPLSLRDMLENAYKRDLLGKYDVKMILEWIRFRNEVVHSDRKVTRNAAAEIVEGVLNIVESKKFY